MREAGAYDGDFAASLADIPEIKIKGATQGEALRNLQAMIRFALEGGVISF